MTDPTPDATSAFERACAAGWNATHPDAYANWDWVCRNDPEAADIWRRSFAAGLRDLRGDATAGLSMGDLEWEPINEWLDAILKDAPE